MADIKLISLSKLVFVLHSNIFISVYLLFYCLENTSLKKKKIKNNICVIKNIVGLI